MLVKLLQTCLTATAGNDGCGPGRVFLLSRQKGMESHQLSSKVTDVRKAWLSSVNRSKGLERHEERDWKGMKKGQQQVT